MSKVFKPFHTVSEYETTKISIDQNNTSYIYGNNLSTVYDTDLTNGIPKDLVSYNTICFVDDIQEIYRNGLNFSGQGKYSYSDSSGKYLTYEDGLDPYYSLGDKILIIGNDNGKAEIGSSSNGAFLGVYNIDAEGNPHSFSMSKEGINISYLGTNYKIDYTKMIELGIMTPMS